jgi:hypothetical protein
MKSTTILSLSLAAILATIVIGSVTARDAMADSDDFIVIWSTDPLDYLDTTITPYKLVLRWIDLGNGCSFDRKTGSIACGGDF